MSDLQSPVVIEAPPLAPPLVSLVNSSGPNAAIGADPHWTAGITFYPETGSLAQPWWDCVGADGAPASDKDVLTDIINPDLPIFRPWYAWSGDHCSTLNNRQSRVDAGEGRALRALLARTSEQIAHELWTGTIATAGAFKTPTFLDAAVLAGGLPVPLAYAFAALDQEVSVLSPNQGMLHVSPRALGLLASALIIRREGDRWLSAMDNVVVSDAGYDGSGTGVAGGGDTEWFFGSDTVRTWLGDPKVYGDPRRAESAAYNDNTVIWLAERPVAYTFSPVCLTSILADLCTVCCTPEA